MTAQQKLAELNSHAGRNWSDESIIRDLAEFSELSESFLREHGPAIAELIEAMAKLRAHNEAPFGSIETPMLSVREYADLCVRRDAALRKLTQDA